MKRDGSVGIEVSRNHVVPCIVNAFVRLAIWLGTFTTLTWAKPGLVHERRPVVHTFPASNSVPSHSAHVQSHNPVFQG
jgi:hypothetical protein